MNNLAIISDYNDFSRNFTPRFLLPDLTSLAFVSTGIPLSKGLTVAY
jgi:hypothetical protein